MFWELVTPLIVSLVTQIAKRLGIDNTELKDYGIYIFTFIIGLIIAGFQYAWKFMPLHYVEVATVIWTGAMAWYEVILKRIQAVRKLGGAE
jgi:uncharacterized transporter YbjL